MTDTTSTPSGTPAAPARSTPALNPAPAPPEMNTPSTSFVRERTRQIQEKWPPVPGEQLDAQPDARAQQQQASPQPSPPSPSGERTVEQELAELRAFKAEQDVRRNTLPKTEAEYLARNSESFKLPPDAAPVAFNEQDPALAALRRFAMANNLDQAQFSTLLDIHASAQAPSMKQQQAQLARLREANLAALGSAGHLRVDAVASYAAARVPNDDGKFTADFIRQSGDARIVRFFESFIKQAASSQRAAEQRREAEGQNPESTKIPGYSQMNYRQIRAIQMQRQHGGR